MAMNNPASTTPAPGSITAAMLAGAIPMTKLAPNETVPVIPGEGEVTQNGNQNPTRKVVARIKGNAAKTEWTFVCPEQEPVGIWVLKVSTLTSLLAAEYKWTFVGPKSVKVTFANPPAAGEEYFLIGLW